MVALNLGLTLSDARFFAGWTMYFFLWMWCGRRFLFLEARFDGHSRFEGSAFTSLQNRRLLEHVHCLGSRKKQSYAPNRYFSEATICKVLEVDLLGLEFFSVLLVIVFWWMHMLEGGLVFFLNIYYSFKVIGDIYPLHILIYII